MSTDTPPPVDDPTLRETLKRCSPSTYYAACKFRARGAPDDLRAVVLGVVERFVERDLRVHLRRAPADDAALRLSEDLGLDSLTMMEVVMIAEEVLHITISNEDLARVRTLGAVQDFIAATVERARRAGDCAAGPESENRNSAPGTEPVHALESPHGSPLSPLVTQRPKHA